VTTIEATVKSVVRNEETGQVLGVQYLRKGSEYREYVRLSQAKLMQCFAPLTFVADGCFSNFRKEFVKKPVQVRSNFVGLILKDAKLPAPNHGHVVLGNSAPILLYQISKHDTRILVDVPGKLPSVSNGDLTKYLRTIVLPDLPISLQKHFEVALNTDRLKSMPNSFLPPSTNTTEGIVLLGDAMNMRHPLTGGGMTVAFNDVVLLSQLLSPSVIPSFNDTELVLSQMRTFHWRRKSLSSVINILAQALYSLFAANGTSFIVSLTS
jgi:squalene monooxygenase